MASRLLHCSDGECFDLVVTCGADDQDAPLCCLSLSGARTFSYLFNMKTRIPGFPRWVEAEHAEDLQYLFGKPFATPLVYFPRHRDLSGYMIAYWTNFARTG